MRVLTPTGLALIVGCAGAHVEGRTEPDGPGFGSEVSRGPAPPERQVDPTPVCIGATATPAAGPPNPAVVERAERPAVEAGIWHFCRLRSSGEVACSGADNVGQASPTADRFVQLSIGQHTCALREDGRVLCWGDNSFCQSSPPDSLFVQISAGAAHTCGVRLDGTLECWGANDYGQAEPPAGQFSSVAAGAETSCAIALDRSLHCWGNSVARLTEPPVGEFIDVSLGLERACALTLEGASQCWWWDNVREHAGPFSRIVDGLCALRPDGQLVCRLLSAETVEPALSDRFIDVAAGGDYMCGVGATDELTCWTTDYRGKVTLIDGPPLDDYED